MRALWSDEAGAVTSIELLVYGTIAGLGIIAGVANLRDAVAAEFTELAAAVLHLNQGYSVAGTVGCSASTNGSQATDRNPGSTFNTTAVTATCSVDDCVVVCKQGLQ